MTLATARTLIGKWLQTDADNFFGDAPSSAELTEQINVGIRAVALDLFLVDTDIALTVVAGQFTYALKSLSPPVVRVLMVTRAGVPFKDYQGISGLYNLEEMRRDYPAFVAGTVTGSPIAATQADGYLHLYPKPTTGETLYLTAQVVPNPMVNGTDDNNELPLPTWTHEAVVLMACTYAADPVTTNEEGLARMARFQQRARETIVAEGRRNRAIYGIESADRMGQSGETEA